MRSPGRTHVPWNASACAREPTSPIVHIEPPSPSIFLISANCPTCRVPVPIQIPSTTARAAFAFREQMQRFISDRMYMAAPYAPSIRCQARSDSSLRATSKPENRREPATLTRHWHCSQASKAQSVEHRAALDRMWLAALEKAGHSMMDAHEELADMDRCAAHVPPSSSTAGAARTPRAGACSPWLPARSPRRRLPIQQWP